MKVLDRIASTSLLPTPAPVKVDTPIHGAIYVGPAKILDAETTCFAKINGPIEPGSRFWRGGPIG